MRNNAPKETTRAAPIAQALKELGTPERAVASACFFKTGPGQYGEGDLFHGVTVPMTRTIVATVELMSLSEIAKLLESPWHEERLAVCLILVKLYKQGDSQQRQAIYDFYLGHAHRVNNWDLVDVSAEHIVGPQLEGTDLSVLNDLALSKLVWERRIAMLACFYFIKQAEPEPALAVATLLAHDDHDLIQKAVGWMLREVGKRIDESLEEAWLQEGQRYKTLPRTMLRYAIERFPETKRQAYLKGTI